MMVLCCTAALCATAAPLPRATPESVGVDPAAIRDFLVELEARHAPPQGGGNGFPGAFMIVKDGRVIAEGAWQPWTLDAPRQVFSMSKSFTSMAIGFAVQEKLLRLDDAVVSFYPEWLPETVSDHLRAMTVRDLLTMQTGHDSDSIGDMFENSRSMEAGFLAKAVPRVPGTYFHYNNGASFMLSSILQRATGQTVVDYLRPRFFDPCGIAPPVWDSHPASGVNFGGWGLRIVPEDAAKFGLLYLQKGRWGETQLLSEEWVAASLAPVAHPQRDQPSTDWSSGYGYQFWCGRDHSFRASGALGQWSLIMPDENAVVVLYASFHNLETPMELIDRQLRPALRGRKSAGPAMNSAELKEWLAGLRVELADQANLDFPDLTRSYTLDFVTDEGQQIYRKVAVEMRDNQVTLAVDGWQPVCRRGAWSTNPPPNQEYSNGAEVLTRLFAITPHEMRLVILCRTEARVDQYLLRRDGDTVRLFAQCSWDATPVELKPDGPGE